MIVGTYEATHVLAAEYLTATRPRQQAIRAQLEERGHLYALAFVLHVCEICWQPSGGCSHPIARIAHDLATAPVRSDYTS